MKNNCHDKTINRASMRPLFRLVNTVVWGLALVMALLLGLLLLPASDTQADGPDTAHLIIQFDENTSIVRPISFTAPISGLAALQMTDLTVVISNTGFGPAVCAIDEVGDSAANCFGTGFWNYSFWNGSDWEAYGVGPGGSALADGAIELYAWSPGFTSPPSPGTGPQFVGVAEALAWLAGQQSVDNGGYGGVGNSIEVLTAIGANGYQGSEWRRQPGAPALSDHIEANGTNFSNIGAAAAGKLAVGLSAGGGCYPFNATRPADTYVAASGIYTGGYGAGAAGAQAWGILGTAALSQTVPAQAVTYLKSLANPDGGWGWESGGSDTNGTALALQALVVAGESLSATEIISGLTYLDAAQNNDGGFPYDPDSSSSPGSDSNSTAYVVQALVAAGQDPLTGTWIISNTNPISYLLSMQLSDGSFAWQTGGSGDQFATRQAIPALLGRPFPVRATAALVECAEPATPVSVQYLPIIVKN